VATSEVLVIPVQSSLEASRENYQTKIQQIQEAMGKSANVIQRIYEGFNKTFDDIRNSHLRTKNGMKNKMASTTDLLLKFLSNKFDAGVEILREASRNWKRGHVSDYLLEHFNYSLSCGDDCPLGSAEAQNCQMSEEGDHIFLDFKIPNSEYLFINGYNFQDSNEAAMNSFAISSLQLKMNLIHHHLKTGSVPIDNFLQQELNG